MEMKPNIVFIMTDQQSYNMMSCAGNNDLKTPALDKLASRGVMFDQTYCTNPVCVPSRVGLMTGRMPGKASVKRNEDIRSPFPPELANHTLGSLMRKAGYETVYGGKIHLPRAISPTIKDFQYITDNDREQLAYNCEKFINSPHSQPFFLFASFINPHDICYMSIKEFNSDNPEFTKAKLEMDSIEDVMRIPDGISEEEFYQTICPELPSNFDIKETEPELFSAFRKERSHKEAAFQNWDEKHWRLLRWAYCRLTEQVDAQIGIVLDAIENAGLSDNSVIIFTSDHGDMQAAHRLSHKSYLYDEAAKVPLIISYPKSVPADRHSNVLTSNGLDLLPTLCDFAQIEVPEEMKGRSFRKFAENPDLQDADRNYIFVESEIGNMIRTERYKYILYDYGENREQLFDLTKDAGETHNMVNDPSLLDVLEEHRKLLKQELTA